MSDRIRCFGANVIVAPITDDRDGEHYSIAERLMGSGLHVPTVRSLRAGRVCFGIVTAVGPGLTVGSVLEQEPTAGAPYADAAPVLRPGRVVAWVIEDASHVGMVRGQSRVILWGRALRAIIDESDTDGPTAGILPVGWQVLTTPEPVAYEILALGETAPPEERDVLLVGEHSDDIRKMPLRVQIERVVACGRGARVVREVSATGVLRPDCAPGTFVCVESLGALPLRVRGRDFNLCHYGRCFYSHEDPAELAELARLSAGRSTTADAVRRATQ
jgi:hypothetical protein